MKMLKISIIIFKNCEPFLNEMGERKLSTTQTLTNGHENLIKLEGKKTIK